MLAKLQFIYHLDALLHVLLFLKVANEEKLFPSAVEFVWTCQLLAEKNLRLRFNVQSLFVHNAFLVCFSLGLFT